MGKVFFIGGTGHIGSEIINEILKKFPDIEITALVRSDGKAAQLKSCFPTIKTITGDLDDLDVVEQASKDAGIVINTAPDVTHAATTAAIGRGLSAYPSTNTFYIHTAGAALIWNTPDGSRSTGKIWSDTANISDILSKPVTAIHAAEDGAVRALTTTFKTHIAIVSPTLVHGLSVSPVHPTPITMPDMVATMRVVDGGFTIQRGANIFSFVHVTDLARIYLALLADALASGGPNEQLWGKEAYYFAADEELTFREMMEALAPEVHRRGAIGSAGIREIGTEQALRAIGDRPDMNLTMWSEYLGAMFGTDMRCRSDRARKLLGWKPEGKGVKEAMPEVVDVFFERGGDRH